MKNSSHYPICFTPIFKHYLWGGNNLSRLFPDKTSETQEPIAESWEMSDLDSDISLIANGELTGTSLRELLNKNGEEVLGKDIYQKSKGKFPLLIKLIDAQKRLSLQVHPDDKYALKREGGKRGKTEMWYLCDTRPESKLMCGFQPQVSPQDFQEALKENQFEKLLQTYPTQKGDSFFIPAGTIHAIDEGNVLFEIQTPSDLTYRIYDWGRVDANGKPRSTHRDKASAVLKYGQPQAGKMEPRIVELTSKFQREILIACSEFEVEKWDLSESLMDFHEESSFLVYCFIEGEGRLNQTPFKEGECFLIPAAMGPIQIQPHSQGTKVSFLRVLPK